MKYLFATVLIMMMNSVFSSDFYSPNGNIKLTVTLEEGQIYYFVSFKQKIVIKNSRLQIETEKEGQILNDLVETSSTSKTIDELWNPILGEQSEIRNHCIEVMKVFEQKNSGIKTIITFRLYNHGIAFRYEFPLQKNLNYFNIKNEQTEFRLTGNHKAFWLPADFDSQEYSYSEGRISDIDNNTIDLNNGIALKSIPSRFAVQSPLMMKTDDGIYLNIFEAAVDNYPVMHLSVDKANFAFTSLLPSNPLGIKAYLQTPAKTPWRTILLADNAANLLESNIILNLNEPCKIENTDWIKPVKYVGIWWEMHVGLSTWDYKGSKSAHSFYQEETVQTKHGATTENAMRYIDFAEKHQFDAVLIEGWNIGWEDWFGNWKEDVFDFTTPYPDFDLPKIASYAQSKGVKLIMHHETSGSASNYERHLDRAFNLMKEYQYPAVKTGYVGKIIPRGEYHDGQTMVNHYHHIVKRAAEYQIVVNSHESSRPTGMHRTWPNYIAAEAARGNEFNGWSIGNPPAHETILPFTRLLGGPMDYTPGIFEIKMNVYDSSKSFQVHTTLAKQLALYVTMYSPLQMAADLPENYERYADAFQFIKDVALDWQKSIYLHAEPGDYLVVARKEKIGERWFIGAITDENDREINLGFSFLDKEKTYEATIYSDSPEAHWQTNPKAYTIRKINITQQSSLKLQLAPGGGAAISLKPLNN
ncbi:MAG: glycoside hydrolase family 97 protein [Bacteroidales bacterium]|nr:glycoside hydrolase family 97 protein [Bacteroidales bacterium]